MAVVGATGAGKSTLLQPARRAHRGRLGHDHRAAEAGCLLVLQEPFLLAGTARENIAMGLDLDQATIDDAPCTIAEAPFLADLPNGLDTEVGERGVGLSGGQRQRLALARALVRHPARAAARRHHLGARPDHRGQGAGQPAPSLAGTTVVAVASRPSTIALADDVLYLADGTVVAHGTHTTS